MIEHEINAWCKSHKVGISIGFGISFYSDNDHIEWPDPEWIIDGVGDSFWENCDEFVVGVDQAKKMFSDNQTETFRKALLEVFGHFSLIYEVDGIKTDLHYEIDLDNIMFSLLEQV